MVLDGPPPLVSAGGCVGGAVKLNSLKSLATISRPEMTCPCRFVVGDVPRPRRQVARRDRQQSGGGEMLLQHDVSGERLHQPNEI